MRLVRKIVLTLAVALGFAASPQAQAAWTKATSPHFIVYSDGSGRELKAFAEDLERFDYLLRQTNNVVEQTLSAPVHVYLVNSPQRVQTLAKRQNIAGYYSQGRRHSFAVSARLEGESDDQNVSQLVLFHEYTHHFMLHHFPGTYPAWFIEGFAEYYATARFERNGNISLGDVPGNRLPTLRELGVYPLKNLFGLTPERMNAEAMESYYAAAWLLTHYLRTTPARNKEFIAYLQDFVAGKPDLDPNVYFAGGLAALQRELGRYVEGTLNYQVYKFGVPPGISVTLSPLAADQAALVYQQIGVLNQPRGDDAKALVADVDAATAKFPGSAYAWGLKTQAYRLADMEDAALAAASRAIAIDPNAAIPLEVTAEILLRRAGVSRSPDDRDKARDMIVRANRADAENPVPLQLFFRYYITQGGEPPEIAFDGLVKAYTLLPESFDIRFLLAQALAHRKEFAGAANLLAPIVTSPHGGAGVANAKRLRDAYLVAAKTGTMPANTPPPAAADD